MSINIEHNKQTHRFETHIDGHTGYLEYEKHGDRVLDFTHTIVPKQIGGRGVGSLLVKHGLDYAREHNNQVLLNCSYVDAYMNKHEGYQSLRA
jgi:hypothetical protein